MVPIRRHTYTNKHTKHHQHNHPLTEQATITTSVERRRTQILLNIVTVVRCMQHEKKEQLINSVGNIGDSAQQWIPIGYYRNEHVTYWHEAKWFIGETLMCFVVTFANESFCLWSTRIPLGPLKFLNLTTFSIIRCTLVQIPPLLFLFHVVFSLCHVLFILLLPYHFYHETL